MAELVWGLIGGVIGYFLRGWIDEHYTERKEARQFRQGDLHALRDDLILFLGEPRAHFTWLESAKDVRNAGGLPSSNAKAQMIADWVYRNASRYPKSRRGAMYLILNVSYQLARGDRHFLDANPKGYEVLDEAWQSLDEYAAELTQELHGAKSK